MGIENQAIENHLGIRNPLETKNHLEIDHLLTIKNLLEKNLGPMMHQDVILSLANLEALLRKKLLRKDYLEKNLIKNLALVDQMPTKKRLAIKSLLVKKNHSVIEK